MKRILVAGIGNIFFGDDAFGCEVAAELAKRPLPDGVTVRDFGIRSYDLAYAMMDDYDATILIDASPRGETPGTIYLIQPEINIEPAKNKLDEGIDEVVNAHSMNPVRALQLSALARRQTARALRGGMRTCRFRARRRRDAIKRNCPGSRHAGGGNDRKADCRPSRRAIGKIFCGQK